LHKQKTGEREPTCGYRSPVWRCLYRLSSSNQVGAADYPESADLKT